jgi:hypothetical protein
MEIYFHAFVTLVNFPLSSPPLLAPKERAPPTNSIGSFAGPRADLDVVKRRKITCSCLKSNPDTWAVQLVVIYYTY